MIWDVIIISELKLNLSEIKYIAIRCIKNKGK